MLCSVMADGSPCLGQGVSKEQPGHSLSWLSECPKALSDSVVAVGPRMTTNPILQQVQRG